MFESVAQNAVLAVWMLGLVLAMWKFVEQPLTSLCVGGAIVLFLVATGFGSSRVIANTWGDAPYWIMAVGFLLFLVAAYVPLNPTYARNPEIDIQAIVRHRTQLQNEFRNPVDRSTDDDNEISRPNLPR